MARLSKIDLLNAILSAVSESNWNTALLDTQHPFRILVYNEQESYRVRIYIWNITHGGGSKRPTDEYRIQITSGVTQFFQDAGEKTLILGWWEEAEIFAGFDFSKHTTPLGASPSFQIRKACLDLAYTNGFAPCLKETEEIAIAFRPDFMMEYIRHLETLHSFGINAVDFDRLNQVAIAPDDISDADLSVLAVERRIVAASVKRRLRAANFRARVLAAYNHRCAFCGIQLNLVQAAHIVPVYHDGGNDETYNGIAACYLHHAAYDQSLITFDEQFNIHINQRKTAHLEARKRADGLDAFRAALRPLIILPPARSDRPRAEVIQLANEIRGWSVM